MGALFLQLGDQRNARLWLANPFWFLLMAESTPKVNATIPSGLVVSILGYGI